MELKWAVPGQIAVGSLPATADDVRFLKREGVMAVLSLHPVPPKIKLLMLGAGIKQVTAEITDFSTPSMEMMADLQEQIGEWIQEERPVLVHCYMGIGRSRTVACCYLVWTGLTPAEAMEAVGEPETTAQRDFVSQYPLHCQPRI